jgi:dTMP kinase
MIQFKKKTHPYNGVMVELCGPDGSGKTTNAHVLAKHFEDRDVEVVLTREPGGCPISESIREMVLQGFGDKGNLCDLTELLLFGAARAQHLAEKIIPALEKGKVVICDRFSLSTRAYQGYGRGLLQEAMLMEKLVHPNIRPDYLISFELPFSLSLERGRTRNQAAQYNDRFEDAEFEFKKKMFDGFLVEISAAERDDPLGVIRVDASQTLDRVQARLKEIVDQLIQFRSLVTE